MSFYPKKLKSINDLEKEKKRLNKQLNQLREEEMFSVTELMAGIKQGAAGIKGGGGILNMALNFLPSSNPIVEMGVNFLKERLSRKAEKKSSNKENETTQENDGPSFGSKVKHAAKSAAIEVITGYIKWKAIELSYKGIRYLVKQRQANKRAAQGEA